MCGVRRIAEVTLDPGYPRNIVGQHRYHYDSEGNLNPQLVAELRYCPQPVQRALHIFEQNGISYVGKQRNFIDATLLTGFWTPQGFVDNAKIAAKNFTKHT